MPSSQTLENEHRQLRAAVDEGLVDGDAIEAYHDLVRFMLEKKPDDREGLIALLREATGTYKDDATLKNDVRYLKLWSIYSTKVDRPVAVYAYLLKKNIGTVWGNTFEEYAAVLERQGEWAKADAVFRDGISRKVKHLSRLKERYAAFQARAPPGSTTAAPEPAPAASASTEAKSSSSSSRSKPGHKRYAYIKAHLKSGGAPAPGKKPEKFAFEFDALYTPAAGEFSWQEVRARHMGLLGRQWPQDAPEPPFSAAAPAMGAVVPASPAQSSPSSSPARVPVDFNGGLTVTRRLGAEPTVTINTKEALADVFGMYNSPERTKKMIPGSKHAPTRRVEAGTGAGASAGARPLLRTFSSENGLNASQSNASFAPFVDNENAVADASRAKTPTSFKPFVDGGEDEDVEPPQRTPFRPFVDEDAGPPSSSRSGGFRPFLDENAGPLSRPQARHQSIPEEEEEEEEMPQAPPIRSKTPTFRPFMDGSDQPEERSKTPRAFGTELPSHPSGFRPYVDENAGPTLAEQDSRTPTSAKTRPFGDSSRSNRAMLPHAPPSSPPKHSSIVDPSLTPTDEDVIEVEGEADTEPLLPSSISADLRPTLPRSSSAPSGESISSGSRHGRTPALSTGAPSEQESASAKASVFAPHTRSSSQTSDVISPTEERARVPSSGPFGFGGSVFSKPGSVFSKPGAKPAPFRPQRHARSQDGENASPPLPAPMFAPPATPVPARAPKRAPLQPRPVTPPPPPEEEEEEEVIEEGSEGAEYEEEGSSRRQIIARCGGVFEAMTPIAERTMEYTMGNTGPQGSPSRRLSHLAARRASTLLDGHIAEEDEEEELEDGMRTPQSISANLFASSSQKRRESTAIPNPCNPFDRGIMLQLLDDQQGEPGYCDYTDRDANLLGELEKFVKKVHSDSFPVFLDERRFVVSSKLGEGAFGAVFQAVERAQRDDTEDEDEEEDPEEEEKNSVALKVVRPRNKWEFHAIRRVHEALSPELRASVVTARELFVFRDESFLVLDLHSHGTLLDIVNASNSLGFARAGSPLDESLVMFFAIELLRIVSGLHGAGIIHGDLKIDNCLVRLQHTDRWERQYAADGSNGWSSKGIVLVDFGRMIDTRAFPEGQTFVGDWPAEVRDCAEMRDGHPWTYETDYFGLAGVLYTLLYGKHIDAGAIVRDEADGRQRLAHPLKRYWQADLWSSLFDVLLNPRTVHPDEALPLCDELAALRMEMEAWLENNCVRPGGLNLQGMLNKIERGNLG